MKTKQPLLRILVLIIVLFISSIQLFPQTITTEDSQITLLPRGKITGPSKARLAERLIEIAKGDITRETYDLVTARRALQPALMKWKKDAKNFNFDKKLYDDSQDLLKKKESVYTSQVLKQKAQIKTYNAAKEKFFSRKPENQSQADYNRLYTECERLNTWKDELDSIKSKLISKRSTLKKYKAKLDKDEANLNAELEHLIYQLNDITLKMGKAYEQLVILKKYTKDIKVVLKKWDRLVSEGATWWVLPMEELKAWSNKGWD